MLAPLLISSLLTLALAQSTWLSGNDTINPPGVYGTQGIPSPMNYPGGRSGQAMVHHPEMKVLYIFGGQGYDSAGTLGKLLLCVNGIN